MRNRRRRFKKTNDESLDPITSVANLFDFSLVFAVALMVALVSKLGMTELLSKEDFNLVKNPGKVNMEIIVKKGNKVEKYKASTTESKNSKSQGKRVGTAYELDNGEIIYVPE